MDDRIELLVLDFKARRYTRRQFVTKALELGVTAAALPALFEMAGRSLGLRSAEGSLPIAEAAPATRTLVLGQPEPVDNPDPPILGNVSFGSARPVVNNINEGILRFKTGTVDVEPSLAASWDISPDGLVYTFRLRPAKFHDGTPVTAQAIKLNYDRQMDDNHPYHFPGMTYKEIVFSSISKVEVVNPTTLRITQSRPSVLLLGLLAMYVEGIVSPAALQKYGKDYFMHPTGSGPYKFERWVKGGEFVTSANADYWGGRSWLNQAIWRTTSDDTVRLQQLLNNEIDVSLGLDPKDIGRVRADNRFQVITGTLLNTMNMLMNTKRPPFDKLEARQAVQFAINKENIKKAVFFDAFTVGAGPIAPGLLGYDKSLESVYAYNPTRAKELVQKSGAGGIPLTVVHINPAFWPQIAQLVLADLQAAGFNVTLQSMDTSAFLAKINAGEHQMSLGQWVYDTGDPDNIMFTTFSTPRADSRLGYQNPEVTKLNTDAQVERSPDKRRDMYNKAQRLVLDDAAYVTVGYRGLAWGAKATIKGLVIGPLGDAVMRGVTIG